MLPIKAPYLPYDELRKVADTFHARYNPSLEIPVHIERIVEYEFGMDIVDMPGLAQLMGKDGWISQDLSTIYVDQFFYQKRPNRYRFTLAHELSHRLIHQEIYESLSFTTIAEWTALKQRIPDNQSYYLEVQANGLAGLLLVPERPLESEFERFVNGAFDAGVDIHELDSNSRRTFDAAIATRFQVSLRTMTIRLERDGHVNQDKEGDD